MLRNMAIRTYEDADKVARMDTKATPVLYKMQPLSSLTTLEDVEISPSEELLTGFPTLPDFMIVKIMQFLDGKGQIVHAISRLNSYVQPFKVPTNRIGRSSLLIRFHVGHDPVNLTNATEPSELLAVLGMSRRWHFIGSHLFYGANSFAFHLLASRVASREESARDFQLRRHVAVFWIGSR